MKRYRPCSPKTIKTRRAELVAFARKAVRIGIPIERLTLLAAPKLMPAWSSTPGLRMATCRRSSPSSGIAGLRWRARRALISWPPNAGGLRATLEEHRQGGLTDKKRGWKG